MNPFRDILDTLRQIGTELEHICNALHTQGKERRSVADMLDWIQTSTERSDARLDSLEQWLMTHTDYRGDRQPLAALPRSNGHGHEEDR